MRTQFKPIHYSSSRVGKLIKRSKIRHTWTFELDFIQHSIDLYSSRFSKKRKIFVDGNIQVDTKFSKNQYPSYPVQIENHQISIYELQDHNFDLRCANQSFQSLYMGKQAEVDRNLNPFGQLAQNREDDGDRYIFENNSINVQSSNQPQFPQQMQRNVGFNTGTGIMQPQYQMGLHQQFKTGGMRGIQNQQQRSYSTGFNQQFSAGQMYQPYQYYYHPPQRVVYQTNPVFLQPQQPIIQYQLVQPNPVVRTNQRPKGISSFFRRNGRGGGGHHGGFGGGDYGGSGGGDCGGGGGGDCGGGGGGN